MRDGIVYGVVGTQLNKQQVTSITAMPDAPEVEIADYEAMVAIPEEVLLAAAKELVNQRENVLAAV